MMLSIISTRESISKSLISQPSFPQISLFRDFYVIRGFSPSVEGLTAYRFPDSACFYSTKTVFL